MPPQEEMPGMNVLAVIMQAPADIMNLATRQMTEGIEVMNAGVGRLATEMAAPPTLPAGLPPIPGVPAAAPPAAPPMAGPAAMAPGLFVGARKSRLIR